MTTKKTKNVGVAVVKTRNIYTNLFQWFRNQLGMNLVAYEIMIEQAVEEAFEKIETKYPGVYDVHIVTTTITNDAAEVIAYGKLDYDD
jgi:uncharacterized protein YbjQ (UPF0145 family)